MRIACLLLTFLLLAACRPASAPNYTTQKTGQFSRAAIAGPHPLATATGLAVLQRGGNAIDAAVAMQFAMAVVYPRAGNLGGGGFLLYRPASGPTAALDFRERAPAAAHRDMYLDSLGAVIPGLSTRGHLAVGVPGTVAGIGAMHQRYGILPWSELLTDAIDYAAEGYQLSATEVARLKTYHTDFVALNAHTPFSDSTVVAGQLLRQPALAATLRRIRDHGPEEFYTGETARLLIAEIESGGGIIQAEDLRAYAPVWRQPIRHAYQQYQVFSMPPSSSGGITLAQILAMLEPYPLEEYGFQTPAAVHVTVEAMRRAYADRAEHLGDSDYYPVPVDSLLNRTYLRERMQDFVRDKAGNSTAVGSGSMPLPESFETTHISIIDEAGNAVSLTTTLNGNFGSKVMVDGAGFFLNNEMDDFSAKPGVPNMFGLVGQEANAIQPGKRMLSSMTPTIVEKDGALFMVLGTPGGSTIITAVAQTLLNVTAYGMSLADAVHAPRFHHQWLPDAILHEPDAMDTTTRKQLEAMGHTLQEVKSMSVVKALKVEADGGISAAADWRNADDDVAGY